MSKNALLVISALTQFVITTGTALSVVGAATNDGISQAAWILAVVGGLIAAAKDIRTFIAEPPK